MKHCRYILFCAVCVYALFASQEAIAQEVVQLNRKLFMEKVWNYQNNPQRWVYEGSLPCVIDFSATWCGPCRSMEPILENMALKYNGKIVVYQIDVDKEPELAAAFGVSSVPAFLFCPINSEPRGAIGAYPAAEFENLIRKILLDKNE